MSLGSGSGIGKRCLLSSCLLAFFTAGSLAVELRPRDYAVELTAQVSLDPPQITLHWQGDQYARSYVINRKARNSTEWKQVGTAAGHDTWFVDPDVTPGVGYEYQVVKEGTLQYMGYGYIYSAINLPAIDDRGRIILLVESSVAEPLRPELDRLEFDLMGDGWRVARQSVPRDAKSTEVKEVIKTLYAQDPGNTRALFLFGNVPVPYSGDMAPDQHENHRGAWPTDIYYADLDGEWTDSSVDSTGSELWWGRNRPGDGKFDQDSAPSALELQVGRVDLSRMTCFINKSPPRDEIDLLRQYLNKNHRFRHGQAQVDSRALIYDRMGLTDPDPLSTMAWRNFTPFVGSNIDVIKWGEYMPAVSTKSFLWSSVVAGGGLTHADGVGTSDAFALHPVNAVFTMFCGSYYGDWDNESNFLRAVIGASGTVLASMYSGQPQWICHTMALGETIGAAAVLTQENGPEGIYIPHNGGAGMVHVTLLGDPSLRAHPIAPPRNVRGLTLNKSILLTWDPTTASKFAGYFVYRADSPSGPFVRITEEPVQSTSYMAEDAAGKFFTVKTAALMTTPSGSYWNTSQGAFFPEPTSTTFGPPSAPRNLFVSNIRPDAITLTWLTTSLNHTQFEVERLAPGESDFVKIATVAGDTLIFQDSSLPAPGNYGYRVRAINDGGASDYSNPVFATTESATVEFVGVDRQTQGSWIGLYGEDGYALPGYDDILPLNASLTVSNAFLFKPTFKNDDLRMVQLPESTNRSANCWVHRYPFAFQLGFADDSIHQVALYIVDYNRLSSYCDVTIHDAVTGQKLDERRFSNNNEGLYAVYNVRRQVTFTIIPDEDFRTNSEIYALFFDVPKVHPVRIEPAGGAFVGKSLVTLSSFTPGVEIRFTLDGSEPGPESPRYTEPLWLYESAQLRARAFKDGLPPSEPSQADFQSAFSRRIEFLHSDEQSKGTWSFAYGTEGFWVPQGGKELPSYAEVILRPDHIWTWSENTTDDRAPFRDRSAQQRVAAAWYAPDLLELDLGVFDTRARSVGLYFLDWDNRARAQEVELLDAAGAVRERFTIDQFANGKYLVLELKGYATLRIRRLSGDNAVLNGIFFDPAPMEISPGTPLPLENLRIANGTFGFTITGSEDHRFCLDESLDLKTWSCLATNLFTGPTFELQLPVNGEARRFIRAHVVP